jgi:hypothetical protein
MAIFQITSKELKALSETSFGADPQSRIRSPMCGYVASPQRDPRRPVNESGYSSYGAADINCDAVGIG